ncbi:PadR family transcriptional regulator [Nocardia sp. NPDC049149]|uniref:PadR family transcriptional regulator n=1 Tax=Nocardia sp. NPDC049149 TaxID=3364315 RepID=UPI0037114385
MGASLIDGSILMLLVERPDHGYALLERLQVFGIEMNGEPGALYRRLHSLERKGLVEHSSIASIKGPPKKVYAATALGVVALRDWVSSVTDAHCAVERWLDAHEALLEQRPKLSVMS